MSHICKMIVHQTKHWSFFFYTSTWVLLQLAPFPYPYIYRVFHKKGPLFKRSYFQEYLSYEPILLEIGSLNIKFSVFTKFLVYNKIIVDFSDHQNWPQNTKFGLRGIILGINVPTFTLLILSLELILDWFLFK